MRSILTFKDIDFFTCFCFFTIDYYNRLFICLGKKSDYTELFCALVSSNDLVKSICSQAPKALE